MLNVKTLTDTMSRMELPQLQQYATLHKNDPYIVTLALSIANQKKQMKAGQAGQAGMMPQPKVADQQIAQMMAPPQQQGMAQAMPEDSGIGQLPAPNMQGMAGGGIVAFDEGGDVPGYADGVFTGEEEMPEWLKAFPSESGIRRVYRAAKQYDKNNPQPVIPKVATSPAGPFDYPAGAKVAPPKALPPASSGAVPPPGVVKPPAPPTGAAPVAAAPVDPMAGITALNTKSKTAAEAKAEAAALGDDTDIRKKLEEYVTSQKKAGEESVSAFEKGIATLPKSYEKYEARLQKEEAEAATDKDKAMGMSIFKAGLAMMSGTSQNAFENIGKGAMVGLEDQQAALKDFKKAQRERDKSFADIEASRLADQRGDLKTKLELQNRASERSAAAEGKMIDGIAKLFDTNTTNARGIYTTGLDIANKNQSTMYATQADFVKQQMADKAALQRTNIQASAPSSEERILSNPALFKKKMDLVTAATGMRGDDALIAPYMKDPTALMLLEKTHPELAAQIRQKIKMRLLQPVNIPTNDSRFLP